LSEFIALSVCVSAVLPCGEKGLLFTMKRLSQIKDGINCFDVDIVNTKQKENDV